MGEINAGSDGPMRMPFMPSESSDNKMTTAFCSYHDKTSESGKSDAAIKRGSKRLGNEHRGIRVIALADIEQPGYAADSPEILVVETEFSARQRQDYAVLGYFRRKLR